MVLVTGGSSSGKSAYAEKLLSEIKDVDVRYYIATMQIFGEEDRARVERHRKLRAGKGFLTIEQPTDLIRVLDQIKNKRSPNGVCALLECMSNLTANEMFSEKFSEGNRPTADAVADKIVSQTLTVARTLSGFIVVTNNVFEDGIIYDESTMEYIRALGEINRRLAEAAERVVEVVAGIPVIWKDAGVKRYF